MLDTAQQQRPPEASRQSFLDAMSLAASSVSIVTTDGPSGRDGVTISAMAPVSADTACPTLLICVNRLSRVAPRLIDNGVFCVNLLGEDQAGLAGRFAGHTDITPESWFDDAGWKQMPTGAPALVGALASFDCEVTQSSLVGTHHVVFGAVRAIRLKPEGRPLIRARRAYRRLEQ